MYKDGILYSSYGENIIPDPVEHTTVEYLLNAVSGICSRGQGSKKWLTSVETGENIQFDQVEPLSRQVASGLYKRGLRAGDVVLYCSDETTWLSTFFIGVWRANGILRATYSDDSADTIVERILESKIKWVICDSPKAPQILSAVAISVPWNVQVVCFGSKIPEECTPALEIMKDDGSELPTFSLKGTDTAAIVGTSGTTGKSKGAIFTHRILTLLFKAYEMGFYYLTYDRTMSMSRSTHISGFLLPFGALAAGKEIYLIAVVSNKNIFQAIQRYKPQSLFGFPKFLLNFANDPDKENYDLSSLEMISTGGAVVSPSFIQTMKSKLGVIVANGYAMTECPNLTTTRDYDPTLKQRVWEDHPDFSVGKLVPGTMLMVRDLNTDLPLGPNQQGELCFKNNLICAGYLNNPEETETTMPGGWLRTGDVGYFDEGGYVFLVDRCKDVFKYITNNVSPSELESIIERHPLVKIASVLPAPDSEGNLCPRAFVTLKDPNASAEEIRQFVDSQVANYKKLRGGVIVLNELPVGKTGKVDRKILSQIQISIPKEFF